MLLAVLMPTEQAAAVVDPTGTIVDHAANDVGIAAVSGDGRWVVYEELFHWDGISLWDSATGESTTIDELGRSPAISDDGRWVAYVIYDNNGSSQEDVFLWDRETGQSRQLSTGLVDSADPSVSDDGGVVVWADDAPPLGDSTTQIWRRSTDQLTAVRSGLGGPLVSGDGRYVFYRTSMTDAARMNVATGAVVPLDAAPQSVSDDGNTMAYIVGPGATPRNGVGLLRVADGSSTDLEFLDRFQIGPLDLELSGDGSTLFFRTAADLVARDTDLAGDTYRWVPSRSSLDFTSVPGDVIVSVSDDGLVAIGRGDETADPFSNFVRYEFPPPLATPEPVEVSELVKPQLTDQVNRLYSAFFLRPPDEGGLRFWRERRATGWTVSRMADNFVASPEFVDRYGALSNAAFVELIYRNLFDREPDNDGRAFWTTELSGGRSRGSVMVEFSESSEYVGLTGTSQPSPPAAHQLWRLYRAYLGRDPDQSGFDFWYGRMANDLTLTAVSEEFARSPEFIETYGTLDDPGFVDLIYSNVLGRTAEPAGRAFWVSELELGRSRGALMVAFSESAEFVQATDSLPG